MKDMVTLSMRRREYMICFVLIFIEASRRLKIAGTSDSVYLCSFVVCGKSNVIFFFKKIYARPSSDFLCAHCGSIA